MTVRKMTLADVEAVVELGKQTPQLYVSEASLFWGVPRLRSWVEADQDVLLVAEEDERIIGVLLTQLHKPSQVAYFSDMVTQEDHRGKGIGSALMQAGLQQAKDQGYTYAYGLTQVDNIRIHELLTKQGFERGEDMVWFEKKPL